ncbi:MAG: hypothetical protein IJ829_02050 [Kiritimatiellae bacterium]|nr:hypothetical protein [Kiritimatiellia bacterium]
MNRTLLPLSLALAAASCAAVAAAPSFTVDDKLPAGNIVVNSITGDVVSVRQDLRDTAGDWFYWAFRVTGAAGRKIRFDFRKADGSPASIVGVRGPVVSTDGGKTFAYPLDGAATRSGFAYTFGLGEDETLFYECHPYVRANWDAFVARHAADAAKGLFAPGRLCTSRKGAGVPCARIGCLGAEKPLCRVFVAARHHCSETMASWVLEGLADEFLADTAAGAWLRGNVELMAVPFVDYDGAQAGDQGKNRRPHDHNRDYTEFIYPETKAIADWIMKDAGGRLDAFFDLHCPVQSGKYNEFVYTPRKSPRVEPCPAAEDRFSRLVESMQSGAMRYRAGDDLPYGESWNNDANYAQGLPSVAWACKAVKGLLVCRTFEIPFANANGAVVTPEACRDFGHTVAQALQVMLSERRGP